MQLGMVGLGRMGGNMTRRLLRGGHEVVVYDQDGEAVGLVEQAGANGASSLRGLVAALQPPRSVWVMVPAGDATERAVDELSGLLSPGDTVIDGGNTYFKDDVARAERLSARGLQYVDVGTSGGVWGLERGYCMTIGGPAEVVERLDPLFDTLAPDPGQDIGQDDAGYPATRRIRRTRSHRQTPQLRQTLRLRQTLPPQRPAGATCTWDRQARDTSSR